MDKAYAKIVLCVTEDWFALSHFQPLIGLLVRLAREVVVVTRYSGREGEIEALGARTINLDYRRSAMSPPQELATVRRLTRVLKDERPDAVHLIAMKPAVLGSLATAAAGVPRTVVHVTGIGYLADRDTLKTRLVRRAALFLVARRLKSPRTWLLVENPDDLALLKENGVDPDGRATILGGAGIDPAAFPALPPPGNDPPVAAYVGRLIRSKGLDVAVAARDLLAERGLPLALDFYGSIDADNPESVSRDEVDAWTRRPDVVWHGTTRDIPAVWRRSDIAILPARGREGMPRALLEAAASARPLVVTDVPGCRHLVRNGVDGFVVRPEDPEALAAALAKLARDADLRKRMGTAARERVLGAFTERHVVSAIEAAYRALL